MCVLSQKSLWPSHTRTHTHWGTVAFTLYDRAQCWKSISFSYQTQKTLLVLNDSTSLRSSMSINTKQCCLNMSNVAWVMDSRGMVEVKWSLQPFFLPLCLSYPLFFCLTHGSEENCPPVASFAKAGKTEGAERSRTNWGISSKGSASLSTSTALITDNTSLLLFKIILIAPPRCKNNVLFQKVPLDWPHLCSTTIRTKMLLVLRHFWEHAFPQNRWRSPYTSGDNSSHVITTSAHFLPCFC